MKRAISNETTEVLSKKKEKNFNGNGESYNKNDMERKKQQAFNQSLNVSDNNVKDNWNEMNNREEINEKKQQKKNSNEGKNNKELGKPVQKKYTTEKKKENEKKVVKEEQKVEKKKHFDNKDEVEDIDFTLDSKNWNAILSDELLDDKSNLLERGNWLLSSISNKTEHSQKARLKFLEELRGVIKSVHLRKDLANRGYSNEEIDYVMTDRTRKSLMVKKLADPNLKSTEKPDFHFDNMKKVKKVLDLEDSSSLDDNDNPKTEIINVGNDDSIKVNDIEKDLLDLIINEKKSKYNKENDMGSSQTSQHSLDDFFTDMVVNDGMIGFSDFNYETGINIATSRFIVRRDIPLVGITLMFDNETFHIFLPFYTQIIFRNSKTGGDITWAVFNDNSLLFSSSYSLTHRVHKGKVVGDTPLFIQGLHNSVLYIDASVGTFRSVNASAGMLSKNYGTSLHVQTVKFDQDVMTLTEVWSGDSAFNIVFKPFLNDIPEVIRNPDSTLFNLVQSDEKVYSKGVISIDKRSWNRINGL